MGLFKEPLDKLAAYLENARTRGALREYDYNRFSVWPEKPSLVLQEDTAVELGSSASSLFMILWTKNPGVLRPGRISVVGPDPSESGREKLPFAQIVIVKGKFDDEYETYRDLRDAVFDARPEGVSVRIWPDRQKVWCRISRDALDRGFNLLRYGSTLINRLSKIRAVEESEVIFVTGSTDDLAHLSPVSDKANDIVEALIRMYEEMNFDCETCEYNDICEEVEALREIRDRLREERNRS